MKKRFFCMSLILVMLLSVSAHAIQSRSITSVPHLSFDGNRQQRFPVCSHIAVTGGIPSADIVFCSRIQSLIAINHAGRTKVRLGTAGRAGDIDSFHARSPFYFWCLGMRVQSGEPVRYSIGHCSELLISQVRYLEKRDEKASLLSVPMHSPRSIRSPVSSSNSRTPTSNGALSCRIAARQPEQSTLQGCGHGPQGT